jgi:hypothetical protein
VFVIVALLGGWFARMDGGGWPKAPEIVQRLLVMSFFVAACVPFAGWWALLSLAGTLGIATGHGQYFPERALLAIKPEALDGLVCPFFGPDWRTGFPPGHVFTPDEQAHYKAAVYGPLYWRCMFGMFVTGTLTGLPAALLAAWFGQPLAALLFGLTGAAKALAYAAGWQFARSTVPAEWINGGLRTALALGALGLAQLKGRRKT